MIKYKLTDQDGYTRRGEENETLWEVGQTISARGDGIVLCTDGVIHFYDSPEMAIVMNPIHADIPNPVLWEIEIDAVIAHDGTKGGCKSATALRTVAVPNITTNQRIRFAIMCALEFYHDAQYVAWANGWLCGHDRSADAAGAAETAARASWAARAAWAADAAW